MNINTLSYIAGVINNNRISWAVGGSVLLYLSGFDVNPNDIDILVDEKDAKRLSSALTAIGEQRNMEPKEPFLTRHFYHYIVKDTEVDVMGGYITKHCSGKYELEFDSNSIVGHRVIDGVSIPLSSLEDWFVLYQFIPYKKGKADLIEKYLKKNGVKNRFLLERALGKELPEDVRKRIINIIGD